MTFGSSLATREVIGIGRPQAQITSSQMAKHFGVTFEWEESLVDGL
jgi:hypothetical protein